MTGNDIYVCHTILSTNSNFVILMELLFFLTMTALIDQIVYVHVGAEPFMSVTFVTDTSDYEPDEDYD